MEHERSLCRRERSFIGRTGTRATLGALAVAVACLLGPAPALALPKAQVIGIPGVDFQLDESYCQFLPPGPQLQVVPIRRGYPVVGFTMEIDVRHANFLLRGCGALPDTYHPIPEFDWAPLVKPPGSTAALDLANPLVPPSASMPRERSSPSSSPVPRGAPSRDSSSRSREGEPAAVHGEIHTEDCPGPDAVRQRVPSGPCGGARGRPNSTEIERRRVH